MRKILAYGFLVVVLLVPEWVLAAAAHRSDTITTYASRTNTTCTAPSGIQNGDVLLMLFILGAVDPGPATPTFPSGFAAILGSYPIILFDGAFYVDVYVQYKIASGESGNYTVTHAANPSQCYLKAVSGGTSAQPASTTNSGTTEGTTTALSITPAGNDALIVFFSSDWGATANALSPPTGTTPTFTERRDPGTDAGLIYVADGVLATAGATGNKTITNNSTAGGASGPWAGMLVAIEASGGGGAETFGFRKRLPQ